MIWREHRRDERKSVQFEESFPQMIAVPVGSLCECDSGGDSSSREGRRDRGIGHLES